MKGYRINPDSKHVDIIIEGLLNKDGFCPCKI
jgi:ferredoxin-thioredoxin reductase catalytic subunit